MLLRRSQGWFTGYNSNVAGHEAGTIRHLAYFGGAPRYREAATQAAAEGYPRVDKD
jgi:hypothetical protein